MCEVVGKALELSMSRRAMFRNAGVAAAAGVAAGSLRPAHAGAVMATPKERAGGRGHRTRLVLLGTAGGPGIYPSVAGVEAVPERYGISSALVVEDAVYLVDCGHGSQLRFVEADVGTPTRPGRRPLEGLRVIFLTHLHSDHTVEYPAFYTTGMWNGLDDPDAPVHIYGPGNRGGLPPVFGDQPAPPVISPEDPTPGTEQMTAYLRRAFATDLNERMRSSGGADVRRTFIPHDIPLPAGVPVPHDTNPMPSVAPFLVFEDDRVRVTATLVDHAPMFPTFAFRFDTDDGSVTFSGDTAPSENLVRLARDTDYLVHEVIDPAWVEGLFPPPRTPAVEALVDHLLESHTTIEQVGPVAERAGAKRLVLNHMVPVDNPESRWREAQEGFSGKLIVGRDLMSFGVGTRRLSRRTQ